MNNLDYNKLPSISVIVPTLNSSKYLNLCLDSINNQDYPEELIEILIIDGGSVDNTIEIAKNYTKKILNNPLRTGEAGKAVGIKKACNEIIALIDSDNILPDKNWFLKMVEPFENKNIIGSEPIEFCYRKKDGFIDRYCALLGINDPICLFFGNYDKKSVLTNKWTGLKIDNKDMGNWVDLKFTHNSPVPTIGANGTLIKKEALLEYGFYDDVSEQKDYFFDIDLILKLKDKRLVEFAKVKTSIIHIYCGNSIKKFFLKQRRRIRDYKKYKNLRNYNWEKFNKISLIKFVLFSFLLFPTFLQSIIGFLKKRDLAWFFHPIACWITLWVYIKETTIVKSC